MENALKNLLNVNVKKCNVLINDGCISNSLVYVTEDNKLLFVKNNSKLGVIYYYLFFIGLNLKY